MEKGLTRQASSINCRGRLLDLSRPVVMGIINLTPDSFYDGGLSDTEFKVSQRVEKMVCEGATIIDLGAASSRPGAEYITPEEEILRLKPYITDLVPQFPTTIFSIDTVHYETAKFAMKQGFQLINDISGGGKDKDLWRLSQEFDAGYVMMHMQGDPSTMQDNPTYNEVTMDIIQYFIEQIQIADKMGFYNFAIDPGFGFGKTTSQNYVLLRQLHLLGILDRPVLVGLSRKSMIYKPLDLSPSDALNGTTALHMIALQQGASILRVHDVKEAVQAINLHELVNMDSN